MQQKEGIEGISTRAASFLKKPAKKKNSTKQPYPAFPDGERGKRNDLFPEETSNGKEYSRATLSKARYRDATPGQKAMATAMAFPDGGIGGRGKISIKPEFISGFTDRYLRMARYVLRNNPIPEGQDYPQRCRDIMAGLLSLTEAASQPEGR